MRKVFFLTSLSFACAALTLATSVAAQEGEPAAPSEPAPRMQILMPVCPLTAIPVVSSIGCPPAGCVEDGAGGERTGRRRHEQHHVGNLARLARPSDRNSRQDELALLELGPAASGLEPPQAATRRAMDEKTPNREGKLMGNFLGKRGRPTKPGTSFIVNPVPRPRPQQNLRFCQHAYQLS